ncbi:hypothetical protein ACLKA6_014931 [Drosophila palustris]
MSKQKRFSYKNTSNIFDMLKNRELCFNGDFEKSSFKQSCDFQPPNLINKRFSHVNTKEKSDQVKLMTRAEMIKYLDAYKTNYELLSFILQPKFRPPQQVLPVFESKPMKPKPQSCVLKAKTYQADHVLPLPSSSTTLQLRRPNSVCFKSNVKRRSNPNPYLLKAANNCTSLSRKTRTRGVSQPPGCSRDKLRHNKRTLLNFHDTQDQEVFYDIESSSRCF